MIKVLNGLRGYAALFVVLAHLPQIGEYSLSHIFQKSLAFTRIAYISVDMFFILSGFLITRNLIKEKNKTGSISLVKFYNKRFLRIFPIYYISILFVWIFITSKDLGYVATYLSNYFFAFHEYPHPLRHTWSLAVEEHFYIFWPAIILLISDHFIKKYLAFVTIGIIGFSVIMLYNLFSIEEVTNLIEKSTNTRMLSLIAGSILAYHEDKMRSISKTLPILFVSLLAYSIAMLSRLVLDPGFLYTLILYIFSFLGCFLLFIYVLNLENKSGFANKIFVNKFIIYLGSISYGLYLYHYIIYYYFGITNVQLALAGKTFVAPIQILLPFILSLIIPIVSFNLIEKPLLKLKNKL